MGTYNIEKIISDYGNGRMEIERAMGHSLQHIGKLIEAQTAANLSRYGLWGKVDTLEKTVHTLQTEIARLTALVEKGLSKRMQKPSPKSRKD